MRLITTLLGSLHCQTDVQLVYGKALLLKYVSSYVTKMHESATSEGLYCTHVTGYQAAHSLLRTVTPLAPEIVFQLSNIKVWWTDKCTVLFRPPFPDQMEGNKVYKMYLQRPDSLTMVEVPSSNAVIHRLHQQFRIVDPKYAAFLDLIRFIRPTQEQVDKMQDGIVLCPEGQLTDQQIRTAFQSHPNSTVMTVSRKGAQRINTIVVGQLFKGHPLTNIPCACVADSQPIFLHRNMSVIFTEKCDKAARLMNSQQATIIFSQNNTIILRLPEGQQVFVYPVTHMEDDGPVTRYPFTPAHAQTIIKAPGQNI